jgi:sugar lactone lactonase YvrE
MSSKLKLTLSLCSSLLLGIYLVLTSGCASSTPTAPVNFNSFSAYATIGAGTMISPTNVLYSNGHLVVMDQGKHALEMWTLSGSLTKSVTVFNGGATFNGIWGLGIDHVTGNIYVPDYNNGLVNVFNTSGTYIANFGVTELSGNIPQGVGISPSGSKVYVLGSDAADSNLSKIYVYNIGGTASSPTYSYTTNFGQSGPVSENLGIYGEGMCVDSSGNVWATDYTSQRVLEYSSTGTYMKTLTSADFASPSYVMVTQSGYVFVSDDTNNIIVVFNTSGTQLGKFGTGQLNTPEGSTSLNNTFYVADYNNNRIMLFH